MSENQRYGPSWTKTVTPDEMSEFYRENVKSLLEDECDGSDPERCVRQEHLHGLKALLMAPLKGRPEKECPECGELNCPGAPRFKGLCNVEQGRDADPGNYCDDCRNGTPHTTTIQNGMHVRVHRHSDLKPMTHTEAFGVLEKEFRTEKAQPVMTGYEDVDNFLWETLEVMRKKGHDYRQGNDDNLLHNFCSVAEQVGSTPEKVWFTYFYKHYAALSTYIKNGGQSESEPIEGRITDMIVYLLLFQQMVQKDSERKEMLHAIDKAAGARSGTPPMGQACKSWPSDNDHQ